MNQPTMPQPDLVPILLFFVLPLGLTYVGLLVWSTKRDRFKR